MHWVDDLTPSQLRLFAIEIVDAVQGAMSTGDYSKVVTVFEGWEATAEVMSSPEIKAAPRTPHRRALLPAALRVSGIRMMEPP